MTSAPVLRIAVVLAVSISVSVPTQAQNKIATYPPSVPTIRLNPRKNGSTQTLICRFAKKELDIRM